MKIFEIIYEAQVQQNLPGMGSNNLRNAANIAGNVAQNTYNNLGKFAPKTPKFATKEALLNYVKNVTSRSPITRAPLSTNRMKLLGNYLRIAQWLNFYDFAVTYSKQMDVIDEMIKAGPDAKDAEGNFIGLSENDGAVARRLIREQLAFDLVSGGVITAIVTKMIKIIPFARFASRGVGALVSIFTGGALAAVAVGEILAVEAISIALQRWLNTPDGIACVKYCVLYMIDPTVELFYNAGMDRFLGEFKHMSEQGGKTLDVNKTVSGTPPTELVNKAGTAIKSAGDSAINSVTKTADQAFGTTTNQAYQDLKKSASNFDLSGGDDTLSVLGKNKTTTAGENGKAGDNTKVAKTAAEPEAEVDPKLKDVVKAPKNPGDPETDPLNATPDDFERYYKIPKPKDPAEIKRLLHLD